MPPPWYNVEDAMDEPDDKHIPSWHAMADIRPDSTTTPTIPGHYQILQAPPRIEGGQRDYYEQRRRAIIQELRALDRLLGMPQTIPERNR